MKIAGKKIETANIEICVIPRGDDYIAFEAQAVLDMSNFDKLCPVPKPTVKIVKGGAKVEDVESPTYKKLIEEYNKKRIQYMILKSLEATEGLEWETVDMSNPNTWENFESELKASGFSEIEVMRIINTVMTANCLNETKLEQARKDFLLSRSLQADQLSYQKDEKDSIQSGEPANV